MVVNEKPHPFLGVVEAQEPLEEQGQERRGLFEEHADQDYGQSFVLCGEGAAQGPAMSSHCATTEPLGWPVGSRPRGPSKKGAWAREQGVPAGRGRDWQGGGRMSLLGTSSSVRPDSE